MHGADLVVNALAGRQHVCDGRMERSSVVEMRSCYGEVQVSSGSLKRMLKDEWLYGVE